MRVSHDNSSSYLHHNFISGEVVHCIRTFGVTSKYADLILNPSSAPLTGLTRILASRTFSASNTAHATGPMVLEAMGIYRIIYGMSKVKKTVRGAD